MHKVASRSRPGKGLDIGVLRRLTHKPTLAGRTPAWLPAYSRWTRSKASVDFTIISRILRYFHTSFCISRFIQFIDAARAASSI